MKRYITLVMIVLLLAALACSTPTGTPPAPTGTLTPTGTENPAETPTVSQTATQEPSATPTPEPGANLFVNPGFEGPFHYTTFDDRNGSTVQFSQVNVAEGWEAWFCDYPYTEGPCPAERRGDGNPDDLVMGRPEYKPIYKRDPHRGDTAQQFFCAFRTCRAGVWQSIATIPGKTYLVRAYVQSWSNYEGDGASELDTQDDRDNSQWRIVWDDQGPRQIYNALGERVINTEVSPTLEGIGHYDQWALLEWEFEAESNQATIYFENLRLFPFPNNDSYIDDASVVCLDCSFITPTPIVSGMLGEGEVLAEVLRIHDAPDIDAPDATHPTYGKYVVAGQTIDFYDVVDKGPMGEPNLDEWWLQLDPAGNYFIPWVHWACEYECVHVEYAGGASLQVVPQSEPVRSKEVFDLTALIELIQRLLEFVPEVAVFAPVIVAVIGALKEKGWLKDGYAGLVQGGLNLVAWLLIAFLPGEYSNKMGDVANVLVWLLPALIGILANMAITKGIYHLFGWFEMPVLGFSHPKTGSAARPS
jgi:hypothetical protein